MKNTSYPHWILMEIAKERTSQAPVDLWPDIERHFTAQDRPVNHRRVARSLVYGLVAVLFLAGALIFVPEARAFTEDIIQRMGIAFLLPDPTNHNVQVSAVEVTEIPGIPPALTEAEIKEQLAFPVMLPAWLPEDLLYTHWSISEYDPSIGGSGKKLSIEYSRSNNFNPANGLLVLEANDGPISAPPLLAESRQQPVSVNGQTAIYIHGGWQDNGLGDPETRFGNLLWDDQLDDAYLTWAQDGVTYLLTAYNLNLNQADLLHIAESLEKS